MKYENTFILAGLLFAGSVMAGGDISPTPDSGTALNRNGDMGGFTIPKSLEFYASDKAAQFLYQRDSSLVSVDDGRITIGFLFDEERDNIFTGSLAVDSTPVFLPGLTLSLGGKVYAALLGTENTDVFGVGIGLEAYYELPVKQFPLILDAAFYYAPDILSFGQSDRIFDWQVNAGLKVRKSVVAFAGFRFLEFDTRPGNEKPDNAVHVGVRWLLES